MVLTNRRGGKAESRADFDEVRDSSESKKSKNTESDSGPYHESAYTTDIDNSWSVLELLKWLSFAILTVVAILVLYNYYTLSSAHRLRTSGADGVLRSSGMSPEERRKTEEQIKKLSKRLWKNTDEELPKPKPRAPIVQELDLSKLTPLQRPIPPSDPDRPHILDLLSGDKFLRMGWHKEALEKFNELLEAFPQSPRARFGAAEAKCSLAEEQRSVKLLEECTDLYKKVSESLLGPTDLRIEAATRLVKSATLAGKVEKRIWAAEKLFELQPTSVKVANQLSFHYLSSGKVSEGKKHLEKILKKWPKNAVARAHMGRILIFEGKVEEGTKAILQGIEEAEIIRKDPTFYTLVGDALTRLDLKSESDALYEKAAEDGVFPSQWQRPLIYEKGLKAEPFWTTAGLPSYSAPLERIHNHLESIKRFATSLECLML
jgi:aspartate beta-hydroxylase